MRKLSLLAVVLLLAACGSGGLGDLGTILGSPSPQQQSSVQATVTFVDTNAQRIDVSVNYVNNLRSTSSGQQSIYYNSNTKVLYQSRQYQVTDLEQGDQISVNGSNDNGRYVADTITVTKNVRGT